ncbi:MAG: nitrate reductase subunit alpha, partial [bacterium]|nr:nitrate reductase subunit alpha [bacterium]
VVRRLKDKELQFSIEDPDAPENWPRVWYIWRGNALMSSAKGHEFFLDHYLGTHTNHISEEIAGPSLQDVQWRDVAPTGKLDLVVDLNFRMDTSALYSDIILPAATWYEKDDLNSTDMHSFIHPLSAAVPPCWESKSDWDIFREIAKSFTDLAKKHYTQPVEDIMVVPLLHDSPAEIAQTAPLDWAKGECEPIPGKTMPNIKIVKRDYATVYDQYCSYGPLPRKNGLGAHGTHYDIEDIHDEYLRTKRSRKWGGKEYISLERAREAANVVLEFASVTNGELAYRSYKDMEEKTGLPLVDLAEGSRDVRTQFTDLQAQPRRLLNSPMWSGLTGKGRAYAPFTYNRERLVPWRTLTGRQHLYLDHPLYIEFGEHLPTYKPKPLPTEYTDLTQSVKDGETLELNYLTPHGKWHIHST